MTIKYATREKNPTNDDNMIYYSEDYPAEYKIIVDYESEISFAADVPTRAEIVRVDVETKTISKDNYAWNPVTRVLTLLSDSVIDHDGGDPRYPTSVGQLVSIIYKIKKTTL